VNCDYEGTFVFVVGIAGMAHRWCFGGMVACDTLLLSFGHFRGGILTDLCFLSFWFPNQVEF
jgi:hypothetical protein